MIDSVTVDAEESYIDFSITEHLKWGFEIAYMAHYQKDGFLWWKVVFVKRRGVLSIAHC